MKMLKSTGDEELLITVKPWKAAQIKKEALKQNVIILYYFKVIVTGQDGKTSDVYKRLSHVKQSWDEC